MGKGQAWEDHPLTRAAAGAISGGVLWWSLDQTSMVNGVGWLTRSGPPWSWVGLFVAIGAVVGGAIGLRSLPIAADDAPAPSLRRSSASDAWPILGLFAGFWPVLGLFAGLLLGGGLGLAGMLLMAGDRKHAWLFPILFFGGAGGSAGLGLLLGGLFAHRRRRSRERPLSA
jgi:hypothetical protein